MIDAPALIIDIPQTVLGLLGLADAGDFRGDGLDTGPRRQPDSSGRQSDSGRRAIAVLCTDRPTIRPARMDFWRWRW